MNEPNEQLTITLTTNIATLRGVGSRRAAAFRRIGIRCVADLILHLPARYETHLGDKSVEEASEEVSPIHGESANFAVTGEIHTARLRQGRKSRYEATLFDGTGTIQLTWFNAGYLRHKIHPGMTLRAWGKAKRYGDYLQLVNPQWKIIEPENVREDNSKQDDGEHLLPIYPASEELSSTMINRLIDDILDLALAHIDDHFTDDYRIERALPQLARAYRLVHRPMSDEDVQVGKRRLAYDELLLQQLGVIVKREHRKRTQRALPLTWNEAIDEHIRARFPFELTQGQSQVIREIVENLQKYSPMNRLVQGDVGSGKTVVALYAILMAVASGYQGALMAPTELLAEQHFTTISNMLAGSQVELTLLTGSLKPKVRTERLERIESGEVDLIVGTHALLTQTVNFKNLAIAVIDEQHRFGVEQRATLRAKSGDDAAGVHTLVMTATPIPRTLSITLFGDLEMSTIRELPRGRMPIATRVMPEARADEVYLHVAERIERGEQAYIVVPVIDESDSGLKDVNSHLQMLENKWLRGKRLAAMHGRLSRDERESIMNDFRDGKIDVLVATTVIEVGVDVPNATMMVIEHAERFGLAQLHQLRGRIGRGSKHSVCVLIADPTTDDGRARVEAIANSTDGFVIAERDLEIRGPGELFGTKQSGMAPFRVAELSRDLKLLQMARRDAEEMIANNPELEGKEFALLKQRLEKAHGKSLGLGDVG